MKWIFWAVSVFAIGGSAYLAYIDSKTGLAAFVSSYLVFVALELFRCRNARPAKLESQDA